jgi:amylosucrase
MQASIKRIILIHSIIMSFGGIPLLYYGDELGVINDYNYLNDSTKNDDNRWMHRSDMDWSIAERRKTANSCEQRIFNGIKKLIAVRANTPEFADFNTRQLLRPENPHIFAYLRWDYVNMQKKILVLCNFSDVPQHLDMSLLTQNGFDTANRRLIDKYTGHEPVQYSGRLVMQAYDFYWLTETL